MKYRHYRDVDTVMRYCTRYFRLPNSCAQLRVVFSPPPLSLSLSVAYCTRVLTNRGPDMDLFSVLAVVVRGGKRIERNETKDGIITLRDICGRPEIEIRDEGFRCRRRAQSADTKRGMPRYTQRHRLEETPDRFVSARLNKHLFGGRARAWCIIRCAWQRAGEGWGGARKKEA